MKKRETLLMVFITTWSLFTLSACKNRTTTTEVVRFEKFTVTPNALPKNVILLIGDGMGLAQIQAATLAQEEAISMQSAQHIGLIDTRSYNNFITDSGAGGTALACGVKTYNGAIGVGPDSLPVPSVLEKASQRGLHTGLVVACPLTHATPAAFYAHQVSRKMDSAIAQDFYGKNITVAMGGNPKFFDLPRLKNEGYDVTIGHKEMLQSEASKLVAFYHAHSTPHRASVRKDWLPDGTQKALDILSSSKKGFFLMVEGSQIDWAGHNNDYAFQVEETLDFDKAVSAALQFAQKDGQTLVIVTADHETGALSLLNQPENVQQVRPHFASENHSGIWVPVLAWGPGANLFSGFYDNTQITHKIEFLLGLDRR